MILGINKRVCEGCGTSLADRAVNTKCCFKCAQKKRHEGYARLKAPGKKKPVKKGAV